MFGRSLHSFRVSFNSMVSPSSSCVCYSHTLRVFNGSMKRIVWRGCGEFVSGHRMHFWLRENMLRIYFTYPTTCIISTTSECIGVNIQIDSFHSNNIIGTVNRLFRYCNMRLLSTIWKSILCVRSKIQSRMEKNVEQLFLYSVTENVTSSFPIVNKINFNLRAFYAFTRWDCKYFYFSEPEHWLS